MTKNKNSNISNNVNFKLKSYPSILIGLYFIGAAYLIRYLLLGFLEDENHIGSISPQLIEIILIVIVLLVFIFSTLTLYIPGKKESKNNGYNLWNKSTKTATKNYLIISGIGLLSIIIIGLCNLTEFILPIFLNLLSVLLIVLSNKQNKSFFILPILSFLLALICFLIPTYWYSSIVIIGTGIFTYGLFTLDNKN